MKFIAIILTIGCMLHVGISQAQRLKSGTTYQTAVGVRGLGTSGISVKHFTKPALAIEGIVGFYPNAFSATVLVERYESAFDVQGLRWYYGIGGHVASQSDVVQSEGIYRRESSAFGLGVDGIFGIEYKIREVPIALSFDFKPFFEVATDGDAFLALDPGLGIKVTF
ncbi:hypothetical protein N7E81_18095 [Reichenbachiella carrageenanivorans]|uniref:Outer membrane protein beta-barrel domain-containing protein n=1 Tax=Reichenbachiella carrageenanivorans TaxID=2979869 RepID=A0ABY6CZD2_9BACT|nr:hypothetical protein [Reichenbachiella carrageenanivorans]UXX79267.1 hypothetical protein N7E81_18095 [Reichenbachiella carrageenanivorans]